MILASVSRCYRTLQQINLILELSSSLTLFFCFPFASKEFELTEYHKLCELPLF